MAAPLAENEDDEWRNCNERKTIDRVALNVEVLSSLLNDFTDIDNSLIGEISSFKSMEDLVNDFDEKLTVCFQNYRTKIDPKAPVNPITENTILRNDEIWNALTSNYGNVMPVDWAQSRACSLHLPALNLEEKPRMDNASLDLSDDEELREQMDMHSIIVACVSEEPLLTADQVIEEIEEMMQDSPDLEAGQNPSQSDMFLLPLGIQRSRISHSYEERVRSLPVAELSELLEEVETAICRYSEELVQHLALRDELEFEKEVKNSFISALIDVQNRQKEHRELLRKKRKPKVGGAAQQSRVQRARSRFSMEGISSAIQNGFRQTFGNSGGSKQYLTTVIPYEKDGGPPTMEELQTLTKILLAMRDDSDKVPSLLTEYILKVLCPT